MADATKPTDVEIMMYLDGELAGAEAEAVARYLEENDDAASVAAGIGQMSELVRGSVDLDADAAEDKLAGLWAGIEKAIDSNGVSKGASVTPVISIQSKSEEKATQELVEKAGWFGGWQSHFTIGAIAAAAAVLFMLVTQRSEKTDSAPAVADTGNQGATQEPKIVPVALRSQEPEVEELEVYDGSGVILTVPADDESDEAATAVIWISSDTDVVEDPI